MSPQYIPHARVKRLLAQALAESVSAAGLAWVVDQEVSVAFGDAFDPMPDIVVWDAAVGDGEGPVPREAVRLIVEVSDASLADDLGDKLEDYARSGLVEYWVADVRGRLVLRHTEARAARYWRREPALFGTMVPWLSRPELAVSTTELTA